MELKFIGDRSGILGTIITPSGKLGKKIVKNGPKIDKNCAKNRVVFVHFQYLFSYNSLLDRKPCA